MTIHIMLHTGDITFDINKDNITYMLFIDSAKKSHLLLKISYK